MLYHFMYSSLSLQNIFYLSMEGVQIKKETSIFYYNAEVQWNSP